MDVMCVLWRAPFEGHSDGGGPQRVQSRRNIWNIPNLLLNFRLETEQGDICFCFLKSHFTLNYWQDGSQLERCTLLWLCLTPFGWRSVSSWYLLCYRVQLLLFLFRIMWIDSQPYLLYWGFICAFELVSLLIYIYIIHPSLLLCWDGTVWKNCILLSIRHCWLCDIPSFPVVHQVTDYCRLYCT